MIKIIEQLTTKIFADGSSLSAANPISVDTIQEFIAKILSIVVDIMVPVVIFFIIYTGFLYVTARGKPEQLDKAHQAFKWTIIGAAIILGAAVLANALSSTISSLGITS